MDAHVGPDPEDENFAKAAERGLRRLMPELTARHDESDARHDKSDARHDKADAWQDKADIKHKELADELAALKIAREEDHKKQADELAAFKIEREEEKAATARREAEANNPYRRFFATAQLRRVSFVAAFAIYRRTFACDISFVVSSVRRAGISPPPHCIFYYRR